MKIRPRLATVATGALVAPLLLVGAAGSALAAPTGEQSDTGAWLAGELVNGLTPGQFGVDQGQSIDVLFALQALEVETAAQDSIVTALEADPEAYVTGEAFGDAGSTYAGATGKLAVAAQTSGADASDFGGLDLLGNLSGLVVADGPEAGRAKDVSAYGDYSNTIGQSWVIRAFVNDEDLAAATATAGFLARQQCADGGFRTSYDASDPETFENLGYVDPSVTCSSEVDATVFAIDALAAASDAGVAGLDDEIDDAVQNLLASQSADGSFQGVGGPSTNSTGLAAATLAGQGEDAAALKAADWVRGVLVTPALAVGPLAPEAGALAKNSAAFTAATSAGIVPAQRHEWIRATAQGAFALSLNPEAGSVTPVAAPADVTAGTDVQLSFAGLAPSEDVEVSFDSGSVAGRSAGFAAVALPTTVTAGRNGVATVTVTIPAAVGPQTIAVRGLGTGRTGSVSVNVVAAAPGGGTPSAVNPGTVVPSDATPGSRAAADRNLADTGSGVGLVTAALAAAAVVVGSGLLLRRSRTA
ncbi:prenyltransferase/squalene oxidase repeat-containing protein [Aeromicrobium sp. Leaf350]|uniref:prenyltransferase/squalene oxidase repeat-containing protein n=1 Tax=Aeromicrobium sp. Leaf350 TaxID=2876565 RepID=UPI001E4DB5C1|nr:prenyltransferase/squalene oxidase repeat-containing protein [Aeromicrobium sp. Leaf350]